MPPSPTMIAVAATHCLSPSLAASNLHVVNLRPGLTWSDTKGGSLYWHAILEYEMTLETLVGKPTDDMLESVKQLQRYKLNPNHSLNDIGLIGTQAFIVQNDLFSLTFKESYGDLKKAIFDLVQLAPDIAIEELEIPTVSVDLNLSDEN